jgi:hypothetical protein
MSNQEEHNNQSLNSLHVSHDNQEHQNNNQATSQHETLFYEKIKKATSKKLIKKNASVWLYNGQPIIRGKYVLCKQH